MIGLASPEHEAAHLSRNTPFIWASSHMMNSASRSRRPALIVPNPLFPTICSGSGSKNSAFIPSCFYASRLHPGSGASTVEVSLVCRSNYRAIAERGVILRTRSFGDYTFTPKHVFASVSDASKHKEPWDYIVVTTKALPDVSDDSEVIQPLVTIRKSAIVLIQNGVGVEEPYRKRFPQNPILSAVTVISAEQIEPGVIVRQLISPCVIIPLIYLLCQVQNRWTRISIGPYTDGIGKDEKPEYNRLFVQLLKNGGVKDAEEYSENDLQMVRWHKIDKKINASMNPSSVLSNGTGNARMSKDLELRHHLRETMLEVFRAAEAVLGRPIPSHLAPADKILTSTERNTGGKPSHPW
ncbi:2-dehydropantoate 2-reductase [Rhizoctonia solani AG-1 IA]|uniref:2-dehydropantoate 2-reductase n=1 Tax=Thanatephorus cucumeris (strain AG1-IA) TaxID=983506 RepID=L8X5A8_THACA|nr:2-dehydropantoate 2-reductase [Rhizoctonia solani AG-1 IA]